MIRPVIFHHHLCHSLCPVPIIEFLDSEGEAVVVAVVDAEHLKSGAVLVRMSEDDGGHNFYK